MDYVYLVNWSTDADADAWNDDRPQMSSGDLAEPNVRFVLDRFEMWDAMALAELFIEDQVEILEGDEEEQDRARGLHFEIVQEEKVPFIWNLEAWSMKYDVDHDGKPVMDREYYGVIVVERRSVGLD